MIELDSPWAMGYIVGIRKGEVIMSDPWEFYYTKGYEDAKNGKRSRIPYNYKLSYVSGRYDFFSNKPSRYIVQT